MIRATKIYETVLYAHDLEAAAQFYVEGLGLPLLSKNDLMVVLGIGTSYLLIFNPAKSAASGRLVPSHGATGQGHVAFAVEPWQLPAFRERLTAAGVEIEAEVSWDGGARGSSLYVRDPAGNSVELAPSHLWSHLPG